MLPQAVICVSALKCPNLELRAYIESDRQLDLYTPVYFIEADALQESFGPRLHWGRLPLSTQTNIPVLARVCLAPSLWLSATPAGVTSQYGTRPICCGNTTQQQTYRVVVIATTNIHFNIEFIKLFLFSSRPLFFTVKTLLISARLSTSNLIFMTESG